MTILKSSLTILKSSGTLLLACLLTTGCLAHRAPHRVKAALEEQLGGHLERKSGIKLGWASTRLVASIVGHEDGADDSLELGDLSGVAVAVYSLEKDGNAGSRLDPAKMGLGNWEPVVRVRSAGEQLLILTKTRRNRIHKMMFFAVDSREVVVGSLRGRLDRLLESVMRGAEKGGPAGARRAMDVKQAKNTANDDVEISP